MLEAAQEEARKKKARDAEICAKIEKQIEQMQKQKIIIVRQKSKQKQYPPINLAEIADMEDDDDGAKPKNKRICKIESVDSKEDLLRRVRL